MYNVVSIPVPGPGALLHAGWGHLFFAEIAFLAGLVGGLNLCVGWECYGVSDVCALVKRAGGGVSFWVYGVSGEKIDPCDTP